MNNISAFSTRYLYLCFLTLSCAIANLPLNGAAQAIGAWETSSNNAGFGIAWNANPSVWQTNTGSGYAIPAGNTPGLSYPDTNTTTITLLPGAFITNSGSIYANQLTVSNGAILGIGSTVSVLHNLATAYDWDIFGGVALTYGNPAINLTNAAVVAVENGGAITNFTGTTKDYFQNYNSTNLLFLDGSLYVMTGSGAATGNATFPLATWSPNSTAMYMPSAAGTKFPTGITNQTFGNFVWNYPLQSGSIEPGTKFCNFSAGTFAVYTSDAQAIEDVPGPGFTLTLGNLLITNCLFYPGASAGTYTINVSGNFIVDHTATFKNNSASAIGNIVFDGTSPQILGMYGIDGSQANFNWTVNPGAIVDFGANLTNTGPLAGSAAFTDNGWVDLEGNTLVVNTNFTGTGIISNSVGAASLIIGNGSFSGNIAGGGPATINLTVNGSNTVFALNSANTYAGKTAITAGTLALAGSASIADSTNITINGGAVFNVSALSSTFALGANQTLQNNGSLATINGAVNTGLGTVSLTYNAGIPSLVITNGNLTLSSGTVFQIFNSGTALPAGTYSVITNATAGNPGSVAGTVTASVAVGGGGIVAGATVALQISGGMLNLVVTSSTPATPKITGISVSGTTLTLSATNGSDGGQYTLLGTTNLNPPVVWIPILTNNFNASGNINLSTNVLNPSIHAEFYILQQP